MSTNQLTTADGYNVKNMKFSAPIPGVIPNSQPPIGYRRISISTKYPDGTVGDLILGTEELFSFGVSENKELGTQKVNGYSLPLCMYNRDGPTPSQLAWVTTFDKIVDRIKKYLVDHKDELELYELTMDQLIKFNPLYWKKEKGKKVEGRGPSLYPKLISSKKNGGKIMTSFCDENGNDLDPMTLIGKYCYATCAIKVESIFIGSKITLQVKLHQANIRLAESSFKPLLPRPTGSSKMAIATSNPLADPEDASDEDEDVPTSKLLPGSAPTLTPSSKKPEPESDDEAGSLNGSDAEPAPAPVPEPVKKKVLPPKKKA